MQYDNELAEIMNKYKPGSATPSSQQQEEEQQQPPPNTVVQQPTSIESTTALPQVPPVAQTLSNGDSAGVAATTPPQVSSSQSSGEAKRPNDKEVLEVLRLRFEDLWRLEVEHATLKRDFNSLEQAKQELDIQKAELQKKNEDQEHQIAELSKGLEEEKVGALYKQINKLTDAILQG